MYMAFLNADKIDPRTVVISDTAEGAQKGVTVLSNGNVQWSESGYGFIPYVDGVWIVEEIAG